MLSEQMLHCILGGIMTGVRSVWAQHRYIVSSGVFHLWLAEFADVEPAKMQGDVCKVPGMLQGGLAGEATAVWVVLPLTPRTCRFHSPHALSHLVP